MKKIQDIDIENKNILLRLDLNVPLIKSEIRNPKPALLAGRSETIIENDKRIREAVPTIKYLYDHGAQKITIISHLGEPKGEDNTEESLWPVANCLAQLLNINIGFDKPQDEYHLSDKIEMLENLRFNPGEEENSAEFAKSLASGQDIFINDAFGTLHRAHASTVGVTNFLPSYAGLLVQKEIENLEKLVKDHQKPFTVILGGAKIATKLPVLKNLTSRGQNFLIGGAVASTMLVARRHHLGKSLIEEESFRDANLVWQNIIDEVDRNIYLPVDLMVSKSLDKAIEVKIIKTSDALDPNYLKDYFVVDIGPETIEKYKTIIENSNSIFWNGNMGVSEVSEFSAGTDKIAETIAKSSARVVIGGGDTVAAVEKTANGQQLTVNNIFLSTGGGATLEFLAGKELPGLKALG